MLTAPLSEYYGRRPVYLVSWFIFAIFQLPQALATNIETILICRFISGFAGSTPLANTGGVVHDLFGRDEGGYAVAIYALSSTDGPPFGNVSMGYIAQYKGWRWLFWVFLIVRPSSLFGLTDEITARRCLFRPHLFLPTGDARHDPHDEEGQASEGRDGLREDLRTARAGSSECWTTVEGVPRATVQVSLLRARQSLLPLF